MIDEILFGDDGRSISFNLDNEVLSQAGYDLIGESSTLYIGYEHNPDAPLETAAGNYLETVEGYQIWGYADRISGDDSFVSEIQYYNYDQQVRIYFDQWQFLVCLSNPMKFGNSRFKTLMET